MRLVFAIGYRRLVPRLGHAQAIGAIAHRLCRLIWKILDEGIRYKERGLAVSEEAKKVFGSSVNTMRIGIDALPPGLAKKFYRTEHLPPGWEKKMQPLPVAVERQLVVLPHDYRRGFIDGSVIVYSPGTHVVIDAVALFR